MPSINCRCVEEFSIGVTFTTPANSGFCFPKVLLKFQNVIIVSEEFFFKILEESIIWVAWRFLNAIDSSKESLNFMEDISKGLFVPILSIILEKVDGFDKGIWVVKGALE